MYKCGRDRGIGGAYTYPPILLFLPCDDDDFTWSKCQLIFIISITVINCLAFLAQRKLLLKEKLKFIKLKETCGQGKGQDQSEFVFITSNDRAQMETMLTFNISDLDLLLTMILDYIHSTTVYIKIMASILFLPLLP